MKTKNNTIKMVVILILIVGIILLIRGIRKNNREKYGYIKDGKVVFSNMLINRGYDKNTCFSVIEVKAIKEGLNSITVSSDMLNKIKEGDPFYNKSIGEMKNSEDLSNKDLYNISKVLELEMVKEDDSLLKYYSTVVGFKKEKKFIEFCDKCFELIKIDSKGV